jgi:hypothetical protein
MFIDEDVLRAEGVTDFKKYMSNPNVDEKYLSILIPAQQKSGSVVSKL